MTIDPIQLAERGARLTGTLPLKGMPRLAQGSHLEDSGDVTVDLSFERGEGERVYLMHGALHARLRVTCQRCLEEMDLELEAAPWMILVKSGEQRKDQGDEADILMADKPLLLSALVEDELLLALPMVPAHEPERCPAAKVTGKQTRAAPADSPPARKNPFAVLGRLKKQTR